LGGWYFEEFPALVCFCEEKGFSNTVAVVTVVRLLIGPVAARLTVIVASIRSKYFTRKKEKLTSEEAKRERSLTFDTRERAAHLAKSVPKKT
jgi:hypothetical protein